MMTDEEILERYGPIFMAMCLQVMVYCLRALITMAEVDDGAR